MARTKMSDSEKSEVAAVRDYLKALEQNAPRRGRRRTTESVGRQLATLEGEMAGASVTRRLSLIQQRIDLEADLEALSQAASVDLTALEAGFATHAVGRSVPVPSGSRGPPPPRTSRNRTSLYAPLEIPSCWK